MLVSAFAEVISLGSVIPFLSVLIAPEKVFNYPLAAKFAQYFGYTTPSDVLLPFTVIFAVAALVAGGIRVLLLWSNNRLSFASGADLSFDIYRRTLYQPYQVHVTRNTSEVSSGLAYKVNMAVEVMRQLLTLVSSSVLLVAIMLLLLVVNAAVASMAAIGFGVCYGLVSWMLRKRLAANAERIAHDTTLVVKVVQEGLGGIRDVLLDGTQPFFCDIYRRAEYRLREALGDNYFIGGSPRFAMEALGMVLIAALAYRLTVESHDSATALMTLGTLALGAQRLLPALQQIYLAWASIAGSKNSLIDALAYLDQRLPEAALLPAPAPLDFNRSIQMKSLRFRYQDSYPWVLDGIDLTIQKGARIGLVGSTGSGKSTILDLLMGLMPPSQGEILVDEHPIDDFSRRAWQRNIAHVPQSIYLSDATIAENIAFGIPKENIDMARVRQAARQARIADFIEEKAEGYGALVGERGIRLSGGQRQRIGIARALYKQASVLVFDEATSALDNTTELEVMEAIDGLDRGLTILIVAHRLTTVKHCDNIVELGGGKIIGQGTFDYLLEHSASFR
jgi:ATP-binding cassette subfamily B protein